MTRRPVLALTMGDVNGIGPEIIVRALADPEVRRLAQLLVIGDPRTLERACQLVGISPDFVSVKQWEQVESDQLFCLSPSQGQSFQGPIEPALAGRFAHDCLELAIALARLRQIDGIVTAPLAKSALQAAGLKYPGHTEILAERCGVNDHAMMLYVPRGTELENLPKQPSARGFGVAHVTLHTSIQSVPSLISPAKVCGKIKLISEFLGSLGIDHPRIAVCALNPHAGEEGLFGDEEQTLIRPGIEMAISQGIQAQGPFPADTLMRRALRGEFDGVVAMYHDQGHIAVKLVAFESAVNITLGLPIIRTSPSHGTAFDIAWKGKARAEGMIQAIRIAAELAHRKADRLHQG